MFKRQAKLIRRLWDNATDAGNVARARGGFSLVGWILLAFCASSGFAAENLIKNGDFESGIASPPEGFAMWGSDQFKIPANYTTVTDNPHSGNHCFRIYHPANSSGYVVTDPRTNAVHPKKGMAYTFSFWARSDTDTPANFEIHSYKSVDPFIDGDTLREGSIAVGKDWKQFTYTFTEGRDFFADACGFIYLAFSATGMDSEAKTLYLDDIVVTESPGQGEHALVDDHTLACDPLPLRLSPGNDVRITVDAAVTLHPVNKLVGGISFHRLAGWTGYPFSKTGEYTLPPDVERAIKDMRLPMTRFYGVGDEPFSLEEAIDKAAFVLDRTGIPQETTVLEFEEQLANSTLTPEQWARGVKYSVSKGYKFRYWEISNEPYSGIWDQGKEGRAFPDSDAYIKHFLEVEPTIRAVQPEALIGIEVDMDQTTWGNYVLKKAAGHYDYIVPHWYDHNPFADFEESVLGANHAILSRIVQVNALLAAYKSGRDACQYDTEWGLYAPLNGLSGEDNPMNANIYGTVYRAVRLLYYARENLVRGASAWEMFRRDGAYGFCIFMTDEGLQDKRSMIYWLYYYFNRHVGDRVLDLSGTAPFYTLKKMKVPNQKRPASVPATPAMATASEDGETMYFMIVNGSWTKDMPCTVELKNFAVKTAEGVLLKHDDPKAIPLLDRKEDFVSSLPVKATQTSIEFMLPGHSIAFIELKQ
jgi:hypothetical protein